MYQVQYLEIVHFFGQLDDFPRAENVDVDRCAYVFVEPDRGRGVEHDVYFVGESLSIFRRQTKSRQGRVTGNSGYLMVKLGPLVFQPHEQLKYRHTHSIKPSRLESCTNYCYCCSGRLFALFNHYCYGFGRPSASVVKHGQHEFRLVRFRYPVKLSIYFDPFITFIFFFFFCSIKMREDNC